MEAGIHQRGGNEIIFMQRPHARTIISRIIEIGTFQNNRKTIFLCPVAKKTKTGLLAIIAALFIVFHK